MKFPKTDFITRLKKSKGILILGHRGCRKSDVFENTLPAFRKAFDAGADGIEIDVETALDGRLVVINRWFANKTFGFFPCERELETIQAYGMEKGIAVPTFDEVCELIIIYPDSIFNVEIKSCDRLLCRTAKQVGRCINRFGIGHQVIVSSFDMNALITMKIGFPGIETAYLFRAEDRVVELKEKGTLKYIVNGFINRSGIKAVLTCSDTLHPEIKLIDENRLSAWQKYAELTSKRINCWTVDSEADFRKAASIGADIVISDNPEKTVDYRSRLKNDTGF
ncbi:MAG: glycerophosphodiester phosphodiesterase [Pseudomonadota bacterium]